MNKILRVDLTKKTSRIEELDDRIVRQWLGGRGLGTKLLYDELPPRIEPLSRDNKLIFATCPLNNTSAPTSARYEVVTKSPLTHTIVGSNSGDRFGVELKKTGYDAVIIEGRSLKPCWLWIENGNVEFHNADGIWGLNTYRTRVVLIGKTHKKVAVTCIGQAGENKVLFASIMNERNQTVGRGGAGAVMGSKNLKAVVVYGKNGVSIADKEKFETVKKRCTTALGEAPIINDLKEYGTSFMIKLINGYGAFPVKNFQKGYFADGDSISGETLKELYFEHNVACADCPVGCGRATKTSTRGGEGPAYETIWALGPACGVSDLEEIVEANYNCNEFGFDPISAGSTIACAMELSERGYFDSSALHSIRKSIGGELEFGDANAVVKLTDLIGKGEGFGIELAKGSLRLASQFGHPELSMSVKGLEIPAYDPRGFKGMGLAYATSNIGASHVRAYLISPEALATPCSVNRFSIRGKPELVRLYQDLTSALDSIGMCLFSLFALNPDHYASLLGAVTGETIRGSDLLEIGERISNLERMFNIREGFTKKDDTLPKRFLEEKLNEGNSKNSVVELDAMLNEYYALREWNEQGIPMDKKLKELGLFFLDKF